MADITSQNPAHSVAVDENVSTFVLVHAAWHDGSAWTDVMHRLESCGHTTFGPTLPGRGPNASTRISHGDLSRSIVNFVVDRDLTDVVLVGHSYGGTVVSKAVEEIADRVRRLVYVAGHVLKDGESMEQAAPPHYRDMFMELAAASSDDTVALPFDVWRTAFINDAEPELARLTYERLCPEPYQPIVEPLDLKKFYSLTTPKSYILGSDDISMPAGDWGYHPRYTSRLGEHRFLELPGSHEVIFTNPNGLADKIIEASGD